jgi:hypothetical protein
LWSSGDGRPMPPYTCRAAARGRREGSERRIGCALLYSLVPRGAVLLLQPRARRAGATPYQWRRCAATPALARSRPRSERQAAWCTPPALPLRRQRTRLAAAPLAPLPPALPLQGQRARYAAAPQQRRMWKAHAGRGGSQASPVGGKIRGRQPSCSAGWAGR